MYYGIKYLIVQQCHSRRIAATGSVLGAPMGKTCCEALRCVLPVVYYTAHGTKS